MSNYEGVIMTIGSTWNIWDFHVHSPHSVLNNQFGNPEIDSTWDTYFEKLQKQATEKKIVAFGITDYFSIEGYLKVVKYREEINQKIKNGENVCEFLENVFVFPNVELRIIPSTSSDHPINLHLLFSPNIVDELEDKLFSKLSFDYQGNQYTCKRDELIRLGKKYAKNNSIEDNIAYKSGVNQFKTNVEQLCTILKSNKDLRKNTIIVISNSSNDGASGIQHSSLAATRQNLYYLADCIFSSNPNDRDYFLGNGGKDSIETIISNYRNPMACIHGSDAHCLEKIGEPDQKRYCWIKAIPSWEGLKQILYEPEARVRIQEDSPETEKSIYTITNINVQKTQVNDSLTISNLNSKINQNLIAIIGGRGSGKTALLDLIASCFIQGKKLEDKITDSFYYRLYSEEEKKKNLNLPIPIELQFKFNHSFSKKVGLDGDVFQGTDIIYLTQNHFDEFTKNPTILQNRIIELIFLDKSNERLVFQDYEQKIKEKANEIQNINLKIKQLNDDILENKESQLQALKQKEGDFEDYKQRLNNSEEIKKDIDKSTKEKTERLYLLQKNKRELTKIKTKLQDHIAWLDSIIKTNTERTEDINIDITNLNIESVKIIPTSLPGISEFKSELDIRLQFCDTSLSQGDQEITMIEEIINNLEGETKELAELRQKINEISNEIDNISGKLDDIAQKEIQINQLEDERARNYIDLVIQTRGQKDFLQKHIDAFNADKNGLSNQLIFSAKISPKNEKQVLDEFVNFINKTSTPENEIRKYIGDLFSDINKLINEVEEFDSSALSNKLLLLTNYVDDLKPKSATTYTDLYDSILRPFFGICLETKFNGKILENLSMGERAIVLLKILLALGDKPLLIDQPEEHLDNRYIYDQLIPTFREAKTMRQIIIATHNANLVVNADAEQIIIAENDKGTISYLIGALEENPIRETLKIILEGGEEAFKKREEKYEISY